MAPIFSFTNRHVSIPTMKTIPYFTGANKNIILFKEVVPSITQPRKGSGLDCSSSLVDQTKRFERYVIKEYIGTVGCTLQSYALRYVIKQF